VKVKELICKLVEEHAAIVRTQHHIQLPCGNGFHDVWILADNEIKWRLYGNRSIQVVEGSPEKLLHKLTSYDPSKSDLSWMQSLTAFLKRIEGKTGVYVDAGWKKGKAKICAVRLGPNDEKDIYVRTISALNIGDAELAAIKLAVVAWPNDLPIYCDNKQAVDRWPEVATWIPREQNKVADKLGNMRH
jgi:hypothetical protein